MRELIAAAALVALTACASAGSVFESPTVESPLVGIEPPPLPAEGAINRVAAHPTLHAVISIDPTALDQERSFRARARIYGDVAGEPVLIKDNIETAGPVPTTAGSLALANNVTN